MLSHKTEVISLGGELGAKPERRRGLNQQCRSVERIRLVRNTRNAAIDFEGLIQGNSTLTVEDVEPVSSQTQLFTFTNFNRIVNSQVQIHCRRRSVGTDAFDNVRESCLYSAYCWDDRCTAL